MESMRLWCAEIFSGKRPAANRCLSIATVLLPSVEAGGNKGYRIQQRQFGASFLLLAELLEWVPKTIDSTLGTAQGRLPVRKLWRQRPPAQTSFDLFGCSLTSGAWKRPVPALATGDWHLGHKWGGAISNWDVPRSEGTRGFHLRAERAQNRQSSARNGIC